MNNNLKINEANEQIKRALLMMKYDSSKTLTENEENIKPQLNEDVGGVTAASAAGGAAAGAGIAAAGLLPGTVAMTGLGGAAFTIGTALGPAGIGATAALSIGGAVLGGAAAVAVLPLAYWLIRKDTGAAASVKALFQMCSTVPKLKELERKFTDNQIRDLSDKIWDAVNYQTLGFMAGTDEEALYSTFQEVSQGTAADVCALYDRYTSTREELYDSLDSDIDSPDEWEKIYRPLRNCVEDSLRKLEEKNPCKEGEILDPKTKKCVGITPVPPPDPGEGKCKPCNSFPMNLWCKNDKIRDIQRCIGASPDGCYGPKTDKKLREKGFVPGNKNTTDMPGLNPFLITQELYNEVMSKCKSNSGGGQEGGGQEGGEVNIEDGGLEAIDANAEF
jgi:hypothetical protein